MHELSIAMSLIELASEEAQRRDIRVVALHLKVGPLSGVVTEALASAFELAREETLVSAARLEIEMAPILTNCSHCRSIQPVVSLQELRCTVCKEPAIDLVGGRELELVALEIKEQ